jgi:hypothetical protein
MDLPSAGLGAVAEAGPEAVLAAAGSEAVVVAVVAEDVSVLSLGLHPVATVTTKITISIPLTPSNMFIVHLKQVDSY